MQYMRWKLFAVFMVLAILLDALLIMEPVSTSARGAGMRAHTSALKSFANKADLLVLAAGGTVKTLIMNNVTLKVDRYITLNTMVAPDFQMVVG